MTFLCELENFAIQVFAKLLNSNRHYARSTTKQTQAQQKASF